MIWGLDDNLLGGPQRNIAGGIAILRYATLKTTDGTSPSIGINRNAWLRTSLRRASPNHQDNISSRRWGSFRQ
ncbi:hypothetical protein NQ317_014148 [Molorchus minor]|uniref:Uncharacterized protein n=1 Tax=Molorchus minor TaxID=1323400 RepID=A0ABQ9J3L9_9CUCU|nr:hypothetical protein NQ317_014148 [Molorchus minor]